MLFDIPHLILDDGVPMDVVPAESVSGYDPTDPETCPGMDQDVPGCTGFADVAMMPREDGEVRWYCANCFGVAKATNAHRWEFYVVMGGRS